MPYGHVAVCPYEEAPAKQPSSLAVAVGAAACVGSAAVTVNGGGVAVAVFRLEVAVVAIDARRVVVALVGSSTAVIAVDRRVLAPGTVGRESR